MTPRNIAVVGSGYMGGGIAQVLALAGARVALADVSAEIAQSNYERLLKEIQNLGERQARKEREKAPGPREVKIFTLRHTEAGMLVPTLRQLLGDDSGLRLAADARSNSLLARGTREDLEVVEAVVGRLDEAARDAAAARPKVEEKK